MCKTLCSTPNSKKGGIDEEKEDGEVREGEREARRGGGIKGGREGIPFFPTLITVKTLCPYPAGVLDSLCLPPADFFSSRRVENVSPHKANLQNS